DVFVEIDILQSFVAFGVYLFKLPSAFTLGVDGQGDAGNGAGGQDGCLEVKVQSGMGRSVIVLTYHQGFNQRAVNRRTVIVLVARRPCKNGQAHQEIKEKFVLLIDSEVVHDVIRLN